MKIAIVRRECGVGLGGAEGYCENVARGLFQKGHDVTIISDRSLLKDIGQIRARVLGRGSIAKNLSFFINVKRILKRQHGFDVVYGLSRIEGADFLRISDPLHAPWLRFGYRDSKIPFFIKRLFPRHLSLLFQEKRAIKTARYIITNSNLVRDQVIRFYGVSGKKIITVYNGVDLKRFCPLSSDERKEVRRELGLNEKDKVIIFSGSDFKRKGLSNLIKALSLMKDKDIRLLVCGNGKRKQVEQLLKDNSIRKRVIFLGMRRDIERLYGASDILCLPTLYDPFANACLEAMACRLPVITTRQNGVSELVERVDKRLVIEKSDPFLIRDSLSYYFSLNEKAQVKLRGKVSGLSMEFSWENHIQKLSSLFLSFVSR